jgi:hypothetical protein
MAGAPFMGGTYPREEVRHEDRDDFRPISGDFHREARLITTNGRVAG